MIYVAVCDDNKVDISIMREFIYEYMEHKNIFCKISLYSSGEELLGADERSDILFLDISMGGMNGIETGIIFKNRNWRTKIIYVTSFSQYWVQAMNGVHAFAYLEKPICRKAIEEQLDEALCRLEKENKNGQRIRFEIIKITPEQDVSTEYMDFNMDDIYYFEYVSRKIIIKSRMGDFFFYSGMKDVIERMKKYDFASCHQSFLINLKYVQKIKGYDLWLENGEKLPVSQKKSKEFREQINLFVQCSIYESKSDHFVTYS